MSAAAAHSTAALALRMPLAFALVHERRDEDTLAARKAVYEVARAKNPHRWGSRDTRTSQPPSRVCVRARKEAAKKEDEAKAA